MAFTDFIKSGGSLDYLFLPSGAWETNKEVAAAQEKIVQRQYQEGLIDRDKQASLLQEIGGTTTFDAYFADPENRPTTAFWGSIKENFVKIPEWINSTLGGTINSIFRAIPWQLWVIGLIALTVFLVIQLRVLQRFQYKG